MTYNPVIDAAVGNTQMLFDTVLIANRGEIALRIIKACKDLDLKSVAVFSEADKNAPYVKAADRAVDIGAADAASSYLDISKIIEAAKRSGAGAIHPGYGFLSENAEFSRICTDNGLVFIGPKSDVIQKMGSKIAAKSIAIEAGIVVVPGYHSLDQSDEALGHAAAKIGVPLMIKASAGGGGRGMRLITDLAHFSSELALARKEAEAAFGDPSVLLERYVENARHVEVQILGDTFGNIIHLFDRDCSIQRNHQKIIEEAPAPKLPEQIREQMLAAALVLSKKVHYDSAGTVEFIFDTDRDAFYFLEMNTRLQVEHPVTEAVTGIDLVQWQIRIALGEKLSLRQEDIRCVGSAIEARVTAEDPAKNYLPQTGRITSYNEPQIEGVRVDSGINEGSVVSHHYDSMLSKVIAHAPTRNAAIRKLKKALDGYTIAGIGTNKGFLTDILSLSDFEAVAHSTKFLSTAFAGGWKHARATSFEVAITALAGYLRTQEKTATGPWHRHGAWRLTQALDVPSNSYFMAQKPNGEMYEVVIGEQNGRYLIDVDGDRAAVIESASVDDSSLTYACDGQTYSVAVTVRNSVVCLSNGRCEVALRLRASEEVFLGRKSRTLTGGNEVYAPMPGLIVEVLVEKGQTVAAGDAVIVLEAMKLLQKLEAPVSGTIAEIHICVGEAPEKDTLLLTITPENKNS